MEWWLIALALVPAVLVAILWLACIVDVIVRPDQGGMAKGLWMLVILLLPLLAVPAYILTRPVVAGRRARFAGAKFSSRTA